MTQTKFLFLVITLVGHLMYLFIYFCALLRLVYFYIYVCYQKYWSQSNHSTPAKFVLLIRSLLDVYVTIQQMRRK